MNSDETLGLALIAGGLSALLDQRVTDDVRHALALQLAQVSTLLAEAALKSVEGGND